MILVVLNHVAGFCLNIDGNTPSLNAYFYEFRMPLFFFISGFVLYKHDIQWNFVYSWKFLKKKFPVQIVSTAIFFLTSTYINRQYLVDNLWMDSKAGYWFTVVLFEYFVLYSLIRTTTLMLKITNYWKDFIILVFGLLFFVLTIPSITVHIPIDQSILNLFCFKHFSYFTFFVIGTLFKKHFDSVQRILDGKLLLLVCLTLFFGLNIFREITISVQYNLFRFLTAVTGIVIIFSFFRSRKELFSNRTKLGKGLCYIGRRTLDIYFLHYFLLPYNLSSVVTVFHNPSIPIVEFFVSFGLSLAIISICLIISNVLRLSPVLAKWLFGVSPSK